MRFRTGLVAVRSLVVVRSGSGGCAERNIEMSFFVTESYSKTKVKRLILIFLL